MRREPRHITISILCLAFLLVQAYGAAAQPRSAGYSVSHFSYSLTYDHWKGSDSFHNVQLSVNIDGLFEDEVRYPGVSASYSYNFILLDHKTDDGGDLRFCAGPGITAGWVNDYRATFGVMFGLKADVSVEYSSARIPFTTGARLSPTLALHTGMKDGRWLLRGYSNGLMKALMPELVVKYDFGRETPENGFGRGRGEHPVGDGSFPRFTFGVESCYMPLLAHYRHYNYIDNEDTRHFDNSLHGGFWSKGAILVNAGVNAGRHLNLSLCSGWARFGSSFEAIPLLLRGTWFFGTDPGADRWFTRVDAGPAFVLHDIHGHPAMIVEAQGGYRLSLSRCTKLDISVGLFGFHSHPTFEDSVMTTISSETGIGISLSSGVTF